jgi:hypothetical protein
MLWTRRCCPIACLSSSVQYPLKTHKIHLFGYIERNSKLRTCCVWDSGFVQASCKPALMDLHALWHFGHTTFHGTCSTLLRACAISSERCANMLKHIARRAPWRWWPEGLP